MDTMPRRTRRASPLDRGPLARDARDRAGRRSSGVRGRASAASLGVAAVAALVLAGCGGDDGGPTEPPPEPEPTTGIVEVSAVTSGDTLDADGYAVTLDGGDEQSLAVDGTATFEDVEEGDHDVEIAGVQINCAPDGDPARTVSVTAEETSTVTYDMACEPALLGRIVFQSDRTGNADVFAMAPDGSGVGQLTDSSSDEIAPAVSPDGQRLALVSNTSVGGGDPEIFVMDVDGSDLTQLTDNTAQEGFPAWSPDGERLAFVSDRTGDSNLFVMDADGSNLVQLTDDAATDGFPAWSPDGSTIAFGRGTDGVGEVMTVSPDGTGLANLTNHAAADGDPAWSPDGSRIAFLSTRAPGDDPEIYVMDADGTNVSRVTVVAGIDRWPTWSPDGSRIIYATPRSGSYEIHAIAPDGTGDENLTASAASDDLLPGRSPARGDG